MHNYFRKYTSNLYGVDINKKSIAAGKRLFPDFILQQNQDLTVPFADEFFDLVFVSAVLKHIRHEDRPTLYKEFKRVAQYLMVFEENADKKETQQTESHNSSARKNKKEGVTPPLTLVNQSPFLC